MSLPPTVNIGSQTPFSTWSEFNAQLFLIQQVLNKVQTVTLCQVQSCTTDGAVAGIGQVNVLPLVNQVDALGLATPHATIYSLPYFRLGAGSNGIILDPQAGDIGVMVTASRDISKVKSSLGQNNPGSSRKFDFADSIYLGTVISASAPTAYLRFSGAGVSLVTPSTLQLSGATIKAGGSPVPVCSQPLVTWINTVLRPALLSAGITVAAPPSDALTSIFEAQ